MGKAVWKGLTIKARAVPLQPKRVQQQQEDVEFPPAGVCCVCLRREEEAGILIALSSKLWRHTTEECSPGGGRYTRALPRLRMLALQVRVEQDALQALAVDGDSPRSDSDL